MAAAGANIEMDDHECGQVATEDKSVIKEKKSKEERESVEEGRDNSRSSIELKKYAEITMKELLGWYGYDKVENQATSSPCKHAVSSTRDPWPESRDGRRRLRRGRDKNQQQVCSRGGSASPGMRLEHGRGGISPEAQRVDEGGTEANLEQPQLAKSGRSDAVIICAWCMKRGRKLYSLASSHGDKEFCSEQCFTQCRRASFKKHKICDWCKHVRHTVNYVDFQCGEDQLQFCSAKCLNQYKMHIFCNETQAGIMPEVESEVSGTNLHVITPEGWAAPSGVDDHQQMLTSDEDRDDGPPPIEVKPIDTDTECFGINLQLDEKVRKRARKHSSRTKLVNRTRPRSASRMGSVSSVRLPTCDPRILDAAEIISMTPPLSDPTESHYSRIPHAELHQPMPFPLPRLTHGMPLLQSTFPSFPITTQLPLGFLPPIAPATNIQSPNSQRHVPSHPVSITPNTSITSQTSPIFPFTGLPPNTLMIPYPYIVPIPFPVPIAIPVKTNKEVQQVLDLYKNTNCNEEDIGHTKRYTPFRDSHANSSIETLSSQNGSQSGAPHRPQSNSHHSKLIDAEHFSVPNLTVVSPEKYIAENVETYDSDVYNTGQDQSFIERVIDVPHNVMSEKSMEKTYYDGTQDYINIDTQCSHSTESVKETLAESDHAHLVVHCKNLTPVTHDDNERDLTSTCNTEPRAMSNSSPISATSEMIVTSVSDTHSSRDDQQHTYCETAIDLSKSCSSAQKSTKNNIQVDSAMAEDSLINLRIKGYKPQNLLASVDMCRINPLSPNNVTMDTEPSLSNPLSLLRVIKQTALPHKSALLNTTAPLPPPRDGTYIARRNLILDMPVPIRPASQATQTKRKMLPSKGKDLHFKRRHFKRINKRT